MRVSRLVRDGCSVIGQKLITIFDLESTGRVTVYSGLVGIVAGLGATGFYFALEWFQAWALGRVEGYFPPAAGSEPTMRSLPRSRRPWASWRSRTPSPGSQTTGCSASRLGAA